MKSQYFLLLLTYCFCGRTAAAKCEKDWTVYKDELCIKSFNKLLNYDEANEYCSSVHSSLLLVKNDDMQAFLANFTSHLYDNMWLGSRFDEAADQFKWEDGEPLNYTNWQEGYTTNITRSGTCIEFKPPNRLQPINTGGKWAFVSCKKRNAVTCQKAQQWSLQDAVNEIVSIRKLLLESNQLHATTRQDLQATKEILRSTEETLKTVNARVVPIGSIYIEYFQQPSPRTLWPDLTWQDISSAYAGLFFRVTGGASAGWGSTQNECAPRLTQMEYQHRWKNRYATKIDIPSSGWSNWGHAGESYHGCECQTNMYFMALHYHTQNCEIRPKNQAVRIWKRTA